MTGPRPQLLLGAEHRCSYLDGRVARSLFMDPALRLDATRYGTLLDLGFRRSGGYVYRPACSACQQCHPARVPVMQFTPNRAQRRCLKRNAGLRLSIEANLDAEHYALYRQYLCARHPGGGMDPDDQAAFRSFLSSRWNGTEILAVREVSGRLLAGAVMDRVPRGLSAVYTYFDPEDGVRSLGTYAVLKQIERARTLNLPYVYLGYWVPGSLKMDYKRYFQPLEVFTPQGWQCCPGTGDSP